MNAFAYYDDEFAPTTHVLLTVAHAARQAERPLTIRGTGGNCDAWFYHFEDGTYLMITHAEDPSVPEFDHEPVTVGHYRDDDTAEPMEYADFRDAGELLEWVRAGFPLDDFERWV